MRIELNQEEALGVLAVGLRKLGTLKSDEDVTAFELLFGCHGDVADYGLTITTEKTHGEETGD